MSEILTFSRRDADLQGAGVLVTRPAHQAETLCELIQAIGGNAIRFPTLEIRTIGHNEVLMQRLSRLSDYDIIIFVSPNAVTQGLALIDEAGGWPAEILIGAVGTGTQQALRKASLEVGILPADRFDSEGLLGCDELQNVNGKKVLIIRGEDGRPLLGDTLRERGAQVDYAAVYKRSMPEVDPGNLLSTWDSTIDIVITTSIDVLNNLVEMMGPAGLEKLRRTPLIIISDRMQARAKELGCQHVLRASGADSDSILRAVIRWSMHKR